MKIKDGIFIHNKNLSEQRSCIMYVLIYNLQSTIKIMFDLLYGNNLKIKMVS